MIHALILTGFLISTSQAGSLSLSLVNTFTDDQDRKNVIVDFNKNVPEAVINHPAVKNLSGKDKKNKVISMVQEFTMAEQQPLIDHMQDIGIQEEQFQSFWAAHRISVKNATLSQLQALANYPADFTIREPVMVKAVGSFEKRQTSEVQWGVEFIHAPDAWNSGYYGQGSVVGVLDTGCYAEHEALRDRYLRTDYAWHDMVNNRSEPYDDNGHGTHCSGIAVGDKRGIGVAPGAKLMCCKALSAQGRGTEEWLLGCGEFFACPDENCDKQPDVVSSSWGTMSGGEDFYDPIISLWRILGIYPVFASGNGGPLCCTLGSPGDRPNQTSVASIDPHGRLSWISSRGCGVLPHPQQVKPNIAAPGSQILSSWIGNPNRYEYSSGTSMATPHVSGTVALLKSLNPYLTYEDYFRAMTLTSACPNGISWFESCTIGSSCPNYGYGSGNLDAGKAVTEVILE